MTFQLTNSIIFQRGRLNHQPVMDDHGILPTSITTGESGDFYSGFFFESTAFFSGENKKPTTGFCVPSFGWTEQWAGKYVFHLGLDSKDMGYMGLSENEPAKKYPMCISISPVEISACYDCYVVPIPHFQTHQDV